MGGFRAKYFLRILSENPIAGTLHQRRIVEIGVQRSSKPSIFHCLDWVYDMDRHGSALSHSKFVQQGRPLFPPESQEHLFPGRQAHPQYAFGLSGVQLHIPGALRGLRIV